MSIFPQTCKHELSKGFLVSSIPQQDSFPFLLADIKVPHHAVAMSYTQIWQKREYWRIFTAAFAHFEMLHLFYNAMGTWAMRELEGQLGTIRFLCLVRQKYNFLRPRV